MNLKDVDLREVYRKWKKDLKGFRGFYRSTPFVSLQDYDDFQLLETHVKRYDKLMEKIAGSIEDGDFCIIDLPFDIILDLALSLNNDYNIKPVLNINMYFNEYGIIGNKENISRLINNSLQLKTFPMDKFAMFYDYDRYNDDLDMKKICDKLNNQYGISDDDFPEGDFIKNLGYKKITVFTKKTIKEDLKEQLDYIKNKLKVNIEAVDEIWGI